MKRAVEAAIAVVTSDLDLLWRDKIEELENRLAETEAKSHNLASKIVFGRVKQNLRLAAIMGEGNTKSRSAC